MVILLSSTDHTHYTNESCQKEIDLILEDASDFMLTIMKIAQACSWQSFDFGKKSSTTGKLFEARTVTR